MVVEVERKMMSERDVEALVWVYEEEARAGAEARDFDLWLRSCGKIALLEKVLERPGVGHPMDRIPYIPYPHAVEP